ncbi:hypothetical protein FQN54_002334 [Arachnomyces sp. PD_36]|nr:hypothetical protein FQN54_002334 [Arachnomyces sp. PD_36]
MNLILALSLASAAAAFVIPNEETISKWPERVPSLPTWEVDKYTTEAEGVSRKLSHEVSYGLDIASNIHSLRDHSVVDSLEFGGDKRSGNEYFKSFHRIRVGSGHGERNRTIYELIAENEHSTEFAKLVSKFDDVVDYLNSTSADYTVFVPANRAFEKFKHAPTPSDEYLKKLISYHVSPVFSPVRTVFLSRTIPTLLKEKELGSNPARISTQFGLHGLTINFYAHIIKADIFATNGVIHAIDELLLPPFPAADILNFLSSDLSTLELGLTKTGLFERINDTSNHAGGTLFAPTNLAFKKLGPKVNGFLFSRWGQKYLKALLKYHIVANHTLYSDAYYGPKDDKERSTQLTHVDLPTLLHNHHLSVDIAHFHRLVSMKINGFTRVSTSDVIAKDGTIHILHDVLIPPKRPGSTNSEESQHLTVEEIIERLEDYMDDSESINNDQVSGRTEL